MYITPPLDTGRRFVPLEMWLFGIALILFLPSSLTEKAVNKTTLELLFSDYDKDVRPNQEDGPLLLEVDLYVESFANIAEANMEYTVFGYLRHYWRDKRFEGKLKETVKLKGSTIEHAWTPDTYISNSRESNLRRKDSEAESALFIFPDGDIFYSKGVKIVASCDMLLEDFPMDTQQCFLTFGSYGHSMKDVIYKWKSDTVTVENKNIAQFEMKHVELDSASMSYVSGNYTQLVISFSFKRRIGYYIIQVFIPDFLVVAISWIVFWLDQDDMGGRVGLGITTILTIMFLLGSVNMSLPRVSYPKAIDWFLIASFLFVFLVLVECIIVYILRPRKKDSKNGAGGKHLDVEMGTNAKLENLPSQDDRGKPKKLLKTRRILSLERFLSEPAILQARGFNGEIPFLPETDAEYKMIDRSSARAQADSVAQGRCGSCEIGRVIDRISRFLFPFAFVLFNLVYWHHYLRK